MATSLPHQCCDRVPQGRGPARRADLGACAPDYTDASYRRRRAKKSVSAVEHSAASTSVVIDT